MSNKMYNCSKCKKSLDPCDAYEYRGAIACDDCFDEVTHERDRQRQAIIKEESAKTDKFKGLDFSDSAIGKANQKLFKAEFEISSQESPRLKAYEVDK